MSGAGVVRRRLLAAAAGLPWAVPALAAGTPQALPDPVGRPALATPRAAGAVLLAITRAGDRLVAVGERGVVLLSDDGGERWRQATAPVSTTLTAVRFADARHGWAVGHAGVVLRTEDGGERWLRQLEGRQAAELVLQGAQAGPLTGAAQAALLQSAQRMKDDGDDKPLLDLHCTDAQQAVVVGAYGLVLGTADGGRTWRSWMDRLDNPKGLHFNAIVARGPVLLVAGEQGWLWRSGDGGRRFDRLASPYNGSWFAAAILSDGRHVVAGLKGRTYFSDDQGVTFRPSQMPVPVTVQALLAGPGGELLALNQAGNAFISTDRAETFRPLPWPGGAPPTAATQAGDGTWVAASLRGPRRMGKAT